MASKTKSFKGEENPALRFITSDTAGETKTTAPKTRPNKAPAPRWSVDPDATPERRTKRVQIVLPPSLHDAARAEAEKQGISLNEMIIRGLEAQILKGAK